MERKRPRKLNFNAPLLSTRRFAGFGHNISDEVSCTNSLVGLKDSSNGIPFCWEQAPGKPKNLDNLKFVDESEETPRPKPPPGRWRPGANEEAGNEDRDDDHHHRDEGCDGDVDNYDQNGDDVFSDTMEVLSLTEAIEIVEKTEKFHRSSKTKSLEPSDLDNLSDHQYCPSPSFIIERFLPDATALAVASTALNRMSSTNYPFLWDCSPTEQMTSPSVSQSQAVIKRSRFSSPKRCGLEMLLPWRIKHKLCGVRSPIKERSIVQQKGTNSTKQQKKLFSSFVALSGDQWRCK